MELRNKPIDELLQLYDSELKLKLQNKKNLSDTRRVLKDFATYLQNVPPTALTAKSFLAQFTDRAPRTLYRYTQMVRPFMRWYGEPIDDLKVKVPKSIPAYTEDMAINRVREAISQKRSHKKLIIRDELLFDLFLKTGLRRAEMANLVVCHVHDDFIEVKGGKGKKDRNVPITTELAQRLRDYIKEKNPEEVVFGLKPQCMGEKIRFIAKRAGFTGVHTHTLRHKFATDVLEKGNNIRVLQELLGHDNLSTTEVYLAIRDEDKTKAINSLDKPKANITPALNGGILEAETDLIITPVYYKGRCGQAYPSNKAWTVPIASDRVLIESIQVHCSETDVSYKVILFEQPAPANEAEWEEDSIMIRESGFEGKLFTLFFSPNLPYTNNHGAKMMHGAICFAKRPFRFDLNNETAKRGYYEAPLKYKVRVRYGVR